MGKSNKKIKSVGGRANKDHKANDKKNYVVKVPDDIKEEKPKEKEVSIPTDIKKQLLFIIYEFRQKFASTGQVSTRFTSKKLLDMYSCLQKAGFSHDHISLSLRNVVPYGGDVIEALDWLCLNLEDDKLPPHFSNALKEEQTKKLRPKFEGQQVDLSTSRLIQTSHKKISQSEIQSPGDKTSVNAKPVNQTMKMKSWILRYAANDSDTEDDDPPPNDAPVTDSTSNPNESYLQLCSQLQQAKHSAAQAKANGKLMEQKEFSKEIQKLLKEMKSLEALPTFLPATKDTAQLLAPVKLTPSTQPPIEPSLPPTQDLECAPTREYRPNQENTPEDTEDDSLGFSLFDSKMEAPTPSTDMTPVEEAPRIKCRRFEYTRQQWTGKSPKQFLLDWCSKHLSSSRKPKFERFDLPRNVYQCQVTVYRPKHPELIVVPDIGCYNVKEAEHLAATLAIYHLCKGQAVYQLLPTPYREVWLEWENEEKLAKLQLTMDTNTPRDELIAEIMTELSTHKYNPSSLVQQADSPSDLRRQPLDTELKAQPSRTEETLSTVKKLLEERTSSEKYLALLQQRQTLPVFLHKDELPRLLRSHNVIVISGETGCGKSTQIPQFILTNEILSRNYCNIIVTEPRRISATSLATRVCEELGEGHPGSPRTLCGYRIRFESRRSLHTRLTYCTTGVLLRKLQDDSSLHGVTHVIVDEVHERSVQSDFLLIILKKLLRSRPDLRIVLMSATLDSGRFSEYFNHCPVVTIPGRSYNVDVFYLEDIVERSGYRISVDSPCCIPDHVIEKEQTSSLHVTQKGGNKQRLIVHWNTEDIASFDSTDLDPAVYSLRTRNTISRLKPHKINLELIVDLIQYLSDAPPFSSVHGAILIFLPGLALIQQLYETMMSDKVFSDPTRYKILALHSILSSDDQSAAFKPAAVGVRKIVLATNIAETGVTIPDVVFVIDTGKVKEIRYNESNQVSSLDEIYVSKASAKQRQGRAGRIRDGYCFRLYTHNRYENGFSSFSIPEIKRVPLEELCLHIMKCNLGDPKDFLSCALDPPIEQSIAKAMQSLMDVGACLRGSVTLSPLGNHLAHLPVHVRIGKMLIFGAIFGCLQEIAIIAACMTVKSPFSTSITHDSESTRAKKSLALANSDHLTLYNVFIGWLQSKNINFREELKYCKKYCLKRNVMLDIQNIVHELLQYIKTLGFSHTSTLSAVTLKPRQIPIIKAVLVAGLYPNVAAIIPSGPGASDSPCSVKTRNETAVVHQSSVNSKLQTSGWIVYHEKIKQSQVYIHESTLVSAYTLLLFGGELGVQYTDKTVCIDEWISIKAAAQTGVIFRESQRLLDVLLNKKLEDPSFTIGDEKLIVTLKELLQTSI